MELGLNYSVIDNLLDLSDLKDLQKILLGNDFPWFLSHKVDKTRVLSSDNDEVYNYQFIHNFYSDHAPSSPYAEILNPLLKKISPAALIRIKANLTPATPHIIEYGMHTDYGHDNTANHSGKSAVFYVNTNNGYTVFENGDKVESVENRLLVFDPTILHSGSSSTDTKNRVVINFNYFEWDK